MKPYQKWSVCQENNHFNIKRWLFNPHGSKKLQRLLIVENEAYRHLKSKKAKRGEFEKLCLILNEKLLKEKENKETWNIDCDFINGNISEKYKKWLSEYCANKQSNKTTVGHLNKYFIEYYLRLNDIKDFTEWRRNENQREFLQWVIDQGKSLSTINAIRSSANSFLKFLSEKSNGEIDYRDIRLTLPSLTPKKMAQIEQNRKSRMAGKDVERAEGQYINQDDFKIILKNCKNYLKPLIYISYYYGLRASESQAVLRKNYKEGYFLIEEQLENIENNRLLKGVLKRKVLHFKLKRGVKLNTYHYLKDIKNNRVHPSTMSKDFSEHMKELGMNFNFHDLRGTWITNLFLQGEVPVVIQMAAGHKNIKVTMGYLRDPLKKVKEDKQFKP